MILKQKRRSHGSCSTIQQRVSFWYFENSFGRCWPNRSYKKENRLWLYQLCLQGSREAACNFVPIIETWLQYLAKTETNFRLFKKCSPISQSTNGLRNPTSLPHFIAFEWLKKKNQELHSELDMDWSDERSAHIVVLDHQRHSNAFWIGF